MSSDHPHRPPSASAGFLGGSSRRFRPDLQQISARGPRGGEDHPSGSRAQRLQAIDLVERLLCKDRARYLGIIGHANALDLAHELAYVAAVLVAQVSGDEDGDEDGLARDREVLERLRERVRRDG
ncbi:hypothetical protein BZB76_1833 [Actinomadura pelletieri DSM 43383]|uniref:Uncharacterized protein n=1 Tax=Actinomadura pelletieri DSM 43383 TaxID=1120940 RepID=A0A495QSR2_9ACTN|nr:hypothetical protein BZB76_1833 [Actinomadura pelletieri DSM 43383]